jgi:FkbM family methyltransferase
VDLKNVPGIQSLKNGLVRMGPNSSLVRLLLSANARLRGFSLRFTGERILLQRGNQLLYLAPASFVEIPVIMECFDQIFNSVEPHQHNQTAVLDFSIPGLHVYRRGGIGFHFPGLPEEDSIEAYTHFYQPKPGDIVWDVGAHAGATTYFLSQAVGPAGRVYAFEPDERTYPFLLKNIAMHKLSNVITVKKALSRMTGSVTFQSDGTVSSGIREYLLYSDRGQSVAVPSISLPDACEEFGCVPQYVKMDIEGAEVAVIEGASDFLRRHAIHFAIESYHPVAGELTFETLHRIFPTIGYSVESSKQFGQMFTWAKSMG